MARDRIRRAMSGKAGAERGQRADASFARAAVWLQAAGYPEAARALATAARSRLPPFWSEPRLEALSRAGTAAGVGWTLTEGSAGLAALCLNASQFLAARGLVFLAGKTAPPDPQSVVRVNRALAELAAALLDASEPGWKARLWMLRALR